VPSVGNQKPQPLCPGAQREVAQGLLEQQRFKEHVRKADAAIVQLREQVVQAKAELKQRQQDVEAAVAEKDAFASKVAEYHGQLVAVQAELSKAKNANEEVRERFFG
jgi:chromosome segregation ATPase